MKRISAAYSYVAIALCFIIFAATSFALLVLAALARLSIIPRAWLRQGPRYACQVVSVLGHKGLMRMKLPVVAPIRPSRPDEPTIVIANHPSFAAAPLFGWLLGQLLDREMVFIGKREHMRNPFIGWPIKLLDCGIFIDRNNRKDALEHIKHELPQMFARGAVAVIFPDQSRPTDEKIRADRLEFLAHNVNTEPFVHTLVPRIGGLRQILAVAGNGARVIDVTAGCDCRELGERDMPLMFRRTYHFHVQEVPHGLPNDPERLKTRLVNRWAAKQRLLGRWKSRRRNP